MVSVSKVERASHGGFVDDDELARRQGPLLELLDQGAQLVGPDPGVQRRAGPPKPLLQMLDLLMPEGVAGVLGEPLGGVLGRDSDHLGQHVRSCRRRGP